MIIQFRDRDNEQRELKEVLDSSGFEFVILYGRRRIGKTELILKATEKKKRIYYLAVGEKNLDRFYSLCVENYPEISDLKKDWETLFKFLKDKIEVIVIDEFQNLIKEDKNILNIFQSVVDTIVKDSKLKLFILGSSISIMTSKVLSYKSPLYGRRTGSMELKHVDFFELKKFFPQSSFKELIDIYGFADGVPYYLTKIDKEFWQWLTEELTKDKSFIKDEVDFLMRYEFDDPSTYKLILEAIANGKTKINEIKDFIKVKRTDISPYIKNLLEIKLVKRMLPITEKTKSRMGRYYLSDNFLKFWFRFVYPNLSSIEERIFDINSIKKEYSSYLGFVFEDVVKQFLIKNRGKTIKFTKIGKWWHHDKEIDWVAWNENKEIVFIECKWSNNVDADEIALKLKEKSEHLKWNNKNRKEYYAIFARSFKTKHLKNSNKNIFLFDLKDLENG